MWPLVGLPEARPTCSGRLTYRGASPPCDAPRDGPSARPTDRRRGPGSARRRGSHAARCKGDVRGELHRQHKGRASGGCVRRASRRRGGVRKVTLWQAPWKGEEKAAAPSPKGEGGGGGYSWIFTRAWWFRAGRALQMSHPSPSSYHLPVPQKERRGWQRPARGGHVRGPPRAASRPVGPAMVQGSGRAMRGTCAPGQRCRGGPY